MNDTGVVVLLMTAPNEASAAAIASALLDERLIACANLVPTVRSLYRWQGQVHDERETLAIIKAPRTNVETIKARLKDLHPYDVPELIQLEVADGLPAYLDWVRSAGS